MAKHRLKKKPKGNQFWVMDYLYVPKGYVPTSHAQTEFEAYLQSEHLEWLLAGKPDR